MNLFDSRNSSFISFSLAILIISFIFTACSVGPAVVLTQPDSTYQPVPGVFRAGAAEVDITPPPGLRLFGYSIPAENKPRGYWTRLKSRAIVLESSSGKRLALVQLDLGAVSGLVHRKVSQRLANLGFNPANVILCASHTHAAPGGFFGASFYNIWASGGLAPGIFSGGYYPQVTDWLSFRIAVSIQEACENLEPAVMGVGETSLAGLSVNRSMEAWRKNFSESHPPYDGIIPTLTVIRIDRSEGDQHVPLAMFAVFPVHATAVGMKNNLYHGDLVGVAARWASNRIRIGYSLDKPFVTAVAVGPQGDVSPAAMGNNEDPEKGVHSMILFSRALWLGKSLGNHMADLFVQLEDRLVVGNFSFSYIERKLSQAVTSQGPLCKQPMPGYPVLGGAEDGRSPLYGKGEVFEGSKLDKPSGCHGVKRWVTGKLLKRILKPRRFPGIAPLQLVRFNNQLLLGFIPGEPTTETGRRILYKLSQYSQCEYNALLATTNEYVSYIATPEEYKEQHFEGALTLYGPSEAIFFQEAMEQLGQQTDNFSQFEKSRTFFPGKQEIRLSKKIIFPPETWKPIDTTFILDDEGKRIGVQFRWRGYRRYSFPSELPAVRVIAGDSTAIGPDGALETDDWLNFSVEQKGYRKWIAKWFFPDGIDSSHSYRIAVERSGLSPLLSDRFLIEEGD